MAAVKGRCLIDTNILLYAFKKDDRRHPRSLSILEQAQSGDIQAVVSVQNLAELYPNLTGPKSVPPDPPQIAVEKIRRLLAAPFIEVVNITQTTIILALEFCQRYRIKKQNYFDAQLVAIMIENEIPTIITENKKDFQIFKDISAISPFDKAEIYRQSK